MRGRGGRDECRDVASAVVQEVVWQAWDEGESLRRIADRAGLQEHHVRRYLLMHGGVRPSLTRPSSRHLSPGEREEISRGIAVVSLHG